MAQSYSIEVSSLDQPHIDWQVLSWTSSDNVELRYELLEYSFFGAPKQVRISTEDGTSFRAVRNGQNWVITNEQGETRLVGQLSNYVAFDGTRLRRKRQLFTNKTRIYHPDGLLLAEGQLRAGFFSPAELHIHIIEPSAYDQEIKAMLVIDLLEQVRQTVM